MIETSRFLKLEEYEEALITNHWSLEKKLLDFFFFKLTLKRKGW